MWFGVAQAFSRFAGARFAFVAAPLAAALGVAGGHASAGVVNIGGNWQAQWADSNDPFVNITAINIVGTTIFISKTATFNQGPRPSGNFPTIPINFIQTGASTVTHIVIENEHITNNTGFAWTGFRMDILAGVGIASFNPTLTAASGGPGPIGFDIAPFTTAAFSDANKRLDIGGGILANGGVWQPGSGANGGQLWINVLSQAAGPFSTFQLKETPVPEPGSMALLGLACLAVLPGQRRRRG